VKCLDGMFRQPAASRGKRGRRVAAVRLARSCLRKRPLVVVFPLLMTTGCSHRATRAECQLIVARSVELQMKQMSETDPSVVARREHEVEAELSTQLGACERRRVSESAITCVQAASKLAELETCLK